MSKFAVRYFLIADCYDRTNIDKPAKFSAAFQQ